MERKIESDRQRRIERCAAIEARRQPSRLRATAPDQRAHLQRSAIRYIDASSRSFLERLLDFWFAPKRFESTALYEHLGVLLVKRYAPTGGDFVNRRFGVTIANIHGTLDSLIQFERMTRRLEAIHVVAFLGFVAFSFWRAVTHQTTYLDFGFAVAVYIVLILSPAVLQRYNRIRVYASIRRLAARQGRRKAGLVQTKVAPPR